MPIHNEQEKLFQIEKRKKLRSPKSGWLLQRLDAAIHTDDCSHESNQQTLIAALTALHRDNRPYEHLPAVIRHQIRVLARRYPDLFAGLIPIEEGHVDFSLKSLKLDRFDKTPWKVEPKQEPLLGGLFANNASGIKSIAQQLTHVQPQNMQPFFPDKNGSLIPLSDDYHYLRSAYTYYQALEQYDSAPYSYYLVDKDPIPVGEIYHRNTHEELLSMSLTLPDEISTFDISNIQARNRPACCIINGSSLDVSWRGEQRSAEYVIDVFKSLYS